MSAWVIKEGPKAIRAPVRTHEIIVKAYKKFKGCGQHCNHQSSHKCLVTQCLAEVTFKRHSPKPKFSEYLGGKKIPVKELKA